MFGLLDEMVNKYHAHTLPPLTPRVEHESRHPHVTKIVNATNSEGPKEVKINQPNVFHAGEIIGVLLFRMLSICKEQMFLNDILVI